MWLCVYVGCILRNAEGCEGASHLSDVTQLDMSSLSGLAGTRDTPYVICHEFYKETGEGHICLQSYRCMWMACNSQLFLETSVNMEKTVGRLFPCLLTVRCCFAEARLGTLTCGLRMGITGVLEALYWLSPRLLKILQRKQWEGQVSEHLAQCRERNKKAFFNFSSTSDISG